MTFFFQPLDQFEIIFLKYNEFNDVTFAITNSFIYLFLVFFLIMWFFYFSMFNLKVWGNNWSLIWEFLYLFMFNLIKQQIGPYARQFFPILFTLFVFILLSNLIGMAIYSFTITSQAIITFSLSFSFFIGIVIIGIYIHQKDFVKTFIPSGSPKALLPFMILIEIISYISKPFSLAIRLFANMMSGHTLLAILANFTFLFSKKLFFKLFLLIIPIVLIIAIIGLETMIALLQAYVFLILICIYLHDSLEQTH